VASIELIGGDHTEPKRPDMFIWKLVDIERMGNLHGRRSARSDQHVGGKCRDALTGDVAPVTILQGTPTCKAGSPDLDSNNNHPVVVAGICHRKFTTQANYRLTPELR
jgi:hypothetical protein